MSHAPVTHRRFGPYTIFEPLARGGMAEVFVALKDGADEICVLKQLLIELESHDTAAKRFYREAHVAAFLQHANIARVVDAGEADDRFYMAMEFIAGHDAEAMFHHLIRQGRMLPYAVSIAIALGVLDGLSYAHDLVGPDGKPLELVHRDLSPRNMMVDYSGQVRIIDFGLARGNVDDFKTKPGMLLGTLRYVSPEQAMTLPVDRRSDLYTLSVVLHELLSGQFMVKDGKVPDVLGAVVRQTPPKLSELNPNLPKALDAVLAKGLEKKPEDRWQTAKEFRDALAEAAGALANVTPASVGSFTSSLFPDQVEEAKRRMALGKRDPAQAGLTRAGVVQPQGLGPSDVHDATRTGVVKPSDLIAPEIAAPTRTAYEDFPSTPSAEPTHVVRKRGALRTDRPEDIPTAVAGPLNVPLADAPPQQSVIIQPPRSNTPLYAVGAAIVASILVAGAMIARALESRDAAPAPPQQELTQPRTLGAKPGAPQPDSQPKIAPPATPKKAKRRPERKVARSTTVESKAPTPPKPAAAPTFAERLGRVEENSKAFAKLVADVQAAANASNDTVARSFANRQDKTNLQRAIKRLAKKGVLR